MWWVLVVSCDENPNPNPNPVEAEVIRKQTQLANKALHYSLKTNIRLEVSQLHLVSYITLHTVHIISGWGFTSLDAQVN